MPIPSSLELFKKLQRNFREIILYAGEFVTELPLNAIDFLVFRNESLILIPGYAGGTEPIPESIQTPFGQWSNLWYTGNFEKVSFPSFNIRSGNLAFGFTFDPAAKKDMMDQVKEAVLHAFRNEFKGRKFFMDPKFEHLPRYPSQKSILHGGIPVSFSHTGDPIPGLYLGEVIACNWTVLIPEGPEREIIQIVIDLEEAENEQKRYHQQDPHREPIESLQKRFEELLPTVAP